MLKLAKGTSVQPNEMQAHASTAHGSEQHIDAGRPPDIFCMIPSLVKTRMSNPRDPL